MKLILTNASSKQSCAVYPRGETVQFFQRRAYKISESTFKRIIKKLCPKPTDDLFSPTYKDENYRLIKWDYNFRGHGDQSEYYVEVLK
jgi:hypothetical protein